MIIKNKKIHKKEKTIPEMTGIQLMTHDELNKLLNAVEEGKFGLGDNFDRDKFEYAFDDDVLIVAYVYEKN